MKPIMKSVIVLAAIAVVCTILLSLGNYFWPKKTSAELIREQIGDLLKDTSITEVKDVDLSQFDSNSTVINAWTAYSGATEIGTVLEVTGTVPGWGELSLFVGFSKTSNQIINIQISTYKAGSVLVDILHETFFNLFYNKDISNINPDSIVDQTISEGMTGASRRLTSKTASTIIIEGYKYYQVNFAGKVIEEKSDMQKVAMYIFGGDCEEEPEIESTQTYSGITVVTYTTNEGNTFYHLSGIEYSSDQYPDHTQAEFWGKPQVYLGVVGGNYKVMFDDKQFENSHGWPFGDAAYINSKPANAAIPQINWGSGSSGATFTGNAVINMINIFYTNVLSV